MKKTYWAVRFEFDELPKLELFYHCKCAWGASNKVIVSIYGDDYEKDQEWTAPFYKFLGAMYKDGDLGIKHKGTVYLDEFKIGNEEVSSWKLEGCQMKSIDFGPLDYSSSTDWEVGLHISYEKKIDRLNVEK